MNFNNTSKLRLNGNKQSIGAMIQAVKTNVRAKKLYLTQVNDEIISAILHLLLDSQSLTIYNSRICSDGAQSIINFIPSATLKKLKISKTKMEPNASVFATIIGAINGSSIHKLSVSEQYVDTNEVAAIIGAIKGSQLIKLSLIECTFCEGGLPAILDAIKHPTLQTLNLKFLDFDNAALTTLTDCIEHSSLTKLSLRGANFGTAMLAANKHTTSATHDRSMLFAAIQRSSLCTLDTRDTEIFCDISDVKNVIGHSCITKFKFNRNLFQNGEIISLLDVMKQNPAYEYLSLANIRLSIPSLITIYDLMKGSNLFHLNLSYCWLNENQLCEIIALIKKSSIVSLNINILSTKVLLAMCDLLENHDLKKINIERASNKMLRLMLPSIKASSLIKCKLSSCIDDDVRTAIRIATTTQTNILKGSRRIKSARS